MTAELSREKKWSMSSREHDVGSARKSVADKEAFATARSADAMRTEGDDAPVSHWNRADEFVPGCQAVASGWFCL